MTKKRKRWFRIGFERWAMWRLERKCLKAAHILQACGQKNEHVQEHINDAKDAIYMALEDLRGTATER